MARERLSLKDQLRDVTVPPRPGVGGGFVELIEKHVRVPKQIPRNFDRVEEVPRELGHKTADLAIKHTEFVAPATPDDALAREACARVDERLFGAQSARFRRHGCYDGDPDHQIALEAIRLSREGMA